MEIEVCYIVFFKLLLAQVPAKSFVALVILRQHLLIIGVPSVLYLCVSYHQHQAVTIGMLEEARYFVVNLPSDSILGLRIRGMLNTSLEQIEPIMFLYAHLQSHKIPGPCRKPRILVFLVDDVAVG